MNGRNSKRLAQAGFTMVEAIVVAVIVAVLAAAAIPLLSNYIASQRQQTVDDLARTGSLAAGSFYRRTNTHPTVADLNLFLPEPDRYTVTLDAVARTVRVTDTYPDPDVLSEAVSY